MAPATRIKICGIDTVANAEVAAAAGATALGLVFAPASARCLSIEQARRVAAAVRGKVLLVGMFVDQDAGYVREVHEALTLDVLQFHGRETGDYCRAFAMPFIRAVRAGVDDPALIERSYPDAWGWLLDTASASGFGGTGQAFDLSLWPGIQAQRWMLAGGLTADNVGAAIRAVQPWYVDVSTGVETGYKGEKDPAKIIQFVSAVQAAQAPVPQQRLDESNQAPTR